MPNGLSFFELTFDMNDMYFALFQIVFLFGIELRARSIADIYVRST